MNEFEKLDLVRIESMNYAQLIGVVRETNRPPGGRNSILEIVSKCFLSRESRVLEIGTSTGTTAFEIGKVIGCEVVGIDIDKMSLQEASERAQKLNLENVSFQYADATQLPFSDESFDLTFCGNVTSLIKDKTKAIKEYLRVTKNERYVAVIPMYYVRNPSAKLVQDVRDALQVNIPVHCREEALHVFLRNDFGDSFEVYAETDYSFDNVPESKVIAYCDQILGRPHLTSYSQDVKEAIAKKYRKYMLLFRENLRYMGFTILILRKSRFVEEPELFTATQRIRHK